MLFSCSLLVINVVFAFSSNIFIRGRKGIWLCLFIVFIRTLQLSALQDPEIVVKSMECQRFTNPALQHPQIGKQTDVQHVATPGAQI